MLSEVSSLSFYRLAQLANDEIRKYEVQIDVMRISTQRVGHSGGWFEAKEAHSDLRVG